jgi:hypothetical protein
MLHKDHLAQFEEQPETALALEVESKMSESKPDPHGHFEEHDYVRRRPRHSSVAARNQYIVCKYAMACLPLRLLYLRLHA